MASSWPNPCTVPLRDGPAAPGSTDITTSSSTSSFSFLIGSPLPVKDVIVRLTPARSGSVTTPRKCAHQRFHKPLHATGKHPLNVPRSVENQQQFISELLLFSK